MDNSAAIDTLERKLSDLERKASAILEVLNDLRTEEGLAPRVLHFGAGESVAGSPSGMGVLQVKPDAFYGKVLQTAAREYLEMRFAHEGGTSPSTPKEIYEAIIAGGYQTDARTPEIGLVGLRSLLRKRTNIFHRLPNGTYGLAKWYPNAKRAVAPTPDATSNANDSDVEEEPN